jgi:DNA mismatch repair ATPase MutS
MASILQSADAKSLVIIDELGRGTSNSDGVGLAWSISEHLQSLLGCLTLMVTHYSMMATELPKLYPNVKVYHMLVNELSTAGTPHAPRGRAQASKLHADGGHRREVSV